MVAHNSETPQALDVVQWAADVYVMTPEAGIDRILDAFANDAQGNPLVLIGSYCFICKCAWRAFTNTTQFSATNSTMAQQLNISESTMRRNLNKLRDLGLIDISYRKDESGLVNLPNVYTILRVPPKAAKEPARLPSRAERAAERPKAPVVAATPVSEPAATPEPPQPLEMPVPDAPDNPRKHLRRIMDQFNMTAAQVEPHIHRNMNKDGVVNWTGVATSCSMQLFGRRAAR